jgi:hypothetical protein
LCTAVPVDAGTVDAGPVCDPIGANACESCLARSCCPQLAACESDPQCAQAQACFDSCFAQGQAMACELACAAAFPSAPGGALLACAATNCLSGCQ